MPATIGVPEIVFIDPQRKHVRLLQRTEAGEYDETLLMTGRLEFRSVPGFHIEVEWIFTGDPPAAFDVTAQLIQQPAGD